MNANEKKGRRLIRATSWKWESRAKKKEGRGVAKLKSNDGND